MNLISLDFLEYLLNGYLLLGVLLALTIVVTIWLAVLTLVITIPIWGVIGIYYRQPIKEWNQRREKKDGNSRTLRDATE